MTAAQGPQGQTNLTVVLAAHSRAPGRPRTPDSKQAHRHQGKTSALRATPESSTPFQDPGGSATALRELKAAVSVASLCDRQTCLVRSLPIAAIRDSSA